MVEAPRHLYVHVPFCPTVCPFCDFHVVERRGTLVRRYLDELAREADELAAAYGPLRLETVYVGGGTPSHLRPEELARLQTIVADRLGWAASEATLEVHPSTVSRSRVGELVELGFDRLSIGVQSASDEVLAELGRPHDAATGLRVAQWAVATGARVSADVITTVPGQDLAAELGVVVDTGVGQVSAYVLTIEPDTPFGRQGREVAEHDALAAMSVTAEVLGAAGFEHYEVSSHARPGEACAHHLAYWRNRFWLGLGPSAASHLPGTGGAHLAGRVSAPPLGRWFGGERGEVTWLGAHDHLIDFVVVGLRPHEGVDLDEVALRTGLDPVAELGAALDTAVAEGLVELDGARLRATDAGRAVLDRLTADLVVGVSRPAA